MNRYEPFVAGACAKPFCGGLWRPGAGGYTHSDRASAEPAVLAREIMGLKAIGAVVLALAVAFTAIGAAAQTTKRKPARVVVTKRSYLDAGTEVRPGERHFTDYVF